MNSHRTSEAVKVLRVYSQSALSFSVFARTAFGRPTRPLSLVSALRADMISLWYSHEFCYTTYPPCSSCSSSFPLTSWYGTLSILSWVLATNVVPHALKCSPPLSLEPGWSLLITPMSLSNQSSKQFPRLFATSRCDDGTPRSRHKFVLQSSPAGHSISHVQLIIATKYQMHCMWGLD